MTETPDLFCLVKPVGRHFHPPHGNHAGVHVQEFLLGNLNVEARGVTLEDLKGGFG